MFNPMQIKLNQLQQAPQSLQGRTSVKGNVSFEQLLQQQISQNQELKFSKHAQARLEQRNINLSSQELQRLNHGLDKASQKGIKETLLIMDNRIFVANVSNKIVITAALEEQLKESVFTNIDGAVIV